MGRTLDTIAPRLGYQAIAENRATLTIAGEGEEDSISIVYRPQQATSPAHMELASRMKAVAAVALDLVTEEDALTITCELAQALADIVIDWDIEEVDDSGERVKVAHTLERLRRVDVITLGALYAAISQDAQGAMSKTAGTRSHARTNGGYSARARQTTSRARVSRKK